MPILLIVDDSKTIQKQIISFCSKNFPDLNVVAANSGEEALALIPEIKENIVVAIFDYNMAGITGIELIEAVKEMIPLKKIILCTANIQKTISTRALELGVTHKEKPLTSETFREVVSLIRGAK